MRNNNELKENVSKSAFLICLLIEISVCLVGFLLQALLIEVGLKYFCYIIFGIMFIYFIGRNYFFISFSSAILGIRWKKKKIYSIKKHYIPFYNFSCAHDKTFVYKNYSGVGD
mgnify:CR=1 FL=1